jgi:hypothetical protein
LKLGLFVIAVVQHIAFNPPQVKRGIETFIALQLVQSRLAFNPPQAKRGIETPRLKPFIYQVS